MLFLGSIVTVAFNVHLVISDYSWNETIYIGADGSITPSEAPISTVDNVTYTFTDNIVDAAPSLYDCAIIVERDDIVLDGADYTLQGSTGLWSVGIQLTGVSNVTMKDMTIRQFYYGIRLHDSSGNNISRNNITNNSESGVDLLGSHNSIISGNTITSNTQYGIYFELSDNNTISENQVTDSIVNVYPYQSSDNIIMKNNITNANTCIYVRVSSNNTVSQNKITHARFYGVRLHGSSNNTISENCITNNDVNGIRIDTSGNKVYHNNFVDNAEQAYIEPGNANIWDDGYPSGGNYWSNYNGTDAFYSHDQNITGSDGMGDNPCVLDSQNNDSYPLMEPITFFDVGIWNGTTYSVQTVSNSTVSDANFSIIHMMISFNVTGSEGTIGFSRVSIPKELLYSPNPMNWKVKVNNTQVPFRVLEEIDGDYTHIYLTYKHDAQQVQIIGTEVIPEFPLFFILPLFMIVTLLTTTVYRRKMYD